MASSPLLLFLLVLCVLDLAAASRVGAARRRSVKNNYQKLIDEAIEETQQTNTNYAGKYKRDFKWLGWQLFLGYSLTDVQFTDIDDFCTAKLGVYNFLIRARGGNGELKFGYRPNLMNFMEAGVKHIQLAEDLPVYIAGEVFLKNAEDEIGKFDLEYNIQSGTYSRSLPIKLQRRWGDLLGPIFAAMFSDKCKGEVQFGQREFGNANGNPTFAEWRHAVLHGYEIVKDEGLNDVFLMPNEAVAYSRDQLVAAAVQLAPPKSLVMASTKAQKLALDMCGHSVTVKYPLQPALSALSDFCTAEPGVYNYVVRQTGTGTGDIVFGKRDAADHLADVHASHVQLANGHAVFAGGDLSFQRRGNRVTLGFNVEFGSPAPSSARFWREHLQKVFERMLVEDACDQNSHARLPQDDAPAMKLPTSYDEWKQICTGGYDVSFRSLFGDLVRDEPCKQLDNWNAHKKC
eukprot:gnl/Spiro4/13324_TR7085_c0_g1_i1.p1 gnl/Spiro4/13324_TR7085_c0_g1~~gnl/Spiro4/13324_TR7085_c0_g1_i1.p1  ORF type:complete len:467 (+),score=156.11 gnl/Spiro4/13324_TR7085_c0_g1_i1:27-1403(+)